MRYLALIYIELNCDEMHGEMEEAWMTFIVYQVAAVSKKQRPVSVFILSRNKVLHLCNRS